MRLFKLFVVASLFGGLAWFATQSVRVETSDREVQITIDRHALREAGARFRRQSRHAVSKVGQALEEAGDGAESERPTPPPTIEKFFSR